MKQVQAWSLSSARAHATGSEVGLTDLDALSGIYSIWRAVLLHGLEAGDLDEAAAAAIEASSRTGRPLGDERFVAMLEGRTGRTLRRRKPGPKQGS